MVEQHLRQLTAGRRRRVGLAIGCLVAVGLAVGLALGLSGGTYGLDGYPGAVVTAGAGTKLGVPLDYTAFLANHGDQTAVLESATLIPLPGIPAPRLAHLAIEAGLMFACCDIGWPPQGGGYHLRPLRGWRIRPGHRAQILYSVLSSRPGDYAAWGVRVRVRVAGTTITVPAWSAGVACWSATRKYPMCRKAFSNRVENLADRLTPG